MNPSVRRQFPIFTRRIGGHSLAYLDTASTAQKPAVVLAAMDRFHRRHYANPHRGVYRLSVEATRAVEGVRVQVATFLHAASPSEVVFTSGATAAINTVAIGWGQRHLKRGDTIVLSELEHHANLVPWQQLAKHRGLRLAFIPLRSNGTLDLGWLARHLTRRVKLVAVTHTSNALGTVVPVARVARLAHAVGARVLVDAAQAAGHGPLDVQHLGCDWLVFSAHKLYGPTGVGVLWGRRELLEQMDPMLFGGEMIRRVTWRSSEFNDVPYKFEAGTLNLAGIVGLGAAISFLYRIGWRAIATHERRLTRLALRQLATVPGLTLYGPRRLQDRASIISFTLDGVHAHDVAQVLDRFGVCVRSGHHCAMPLMSRLGVPATVRVSFGVYSREKDVNRLIDGLREAGRVFGLNRKVKSKK